MLPIVVPAPTVAEPTERGRRAYGTFFAGRTPAYPKSNPTHESVPPAPPTTGVHAPHSPRNVAGRPLRRLVQHQDPVTSGAHVGLQELGAMRVEQPRQPAPATGQRLSARPDRPTMKYPVGLGLASETAAREAVAEQRKAFAPKALFADTLRRREKGIYGRAGKAGRRRSGGGAAAVPTGGAAADGGGEAVAAALDASISTIEHQYSQMDRSLLSSLAHVGRDDMAQVLMKEQDEKRNRQLRSELEHWIHSSRQRVGLLHHEAFDAAALTPTSARASLKEGVRTPLELVRSELRARHLSRNLAARAEAELIALMAEQTGGEHAADEVAAAPAPAGATELPSMA